MSNNSKALKYLIGYPLEAIWFYLVWAQGIGWPVLGLYVLVGAWVAGMVYYELEKEETQYLGCAATFGFFFWPPLALISLPISIAKLVRWMARKVDER